MKQQSAFEIMLQLYMLDSGIVPITCTFACPKKEIKAYMATLSPEDRRITARKFRKMWKRAVKQALALDRQDRGRTKIQKRRRVFQIARLEEKMLRLKSASPSTKPTPHQQRERSYMVLEMLMRNVRNELALAGAKTHPG